MDPDLFLTIGIVLVVLTIPSLLSAWTEGRPPRTGAIILIAASGLIVFASLNKPSGYELKDIPSVMLSVVGRVLH